MTWTSLDDRDGFAKRHAFRLVQPIGYARERKRRRPLYVSRKRVSDNNSSLSSDRLDANRLTSGVSERRGGRASLSGSRRTMIIQRRPKNASAVKLACIMDAITEIRP